MSVQYKDQRVYIVGTKKYIVNDYVAYSVETNGYAICVLRSIECLIKEYTLKWLDVEYAV